MDFQEYIKPELLILIPVLVAIGYGPVSYTHLDVYKRQVIRRAGSSFTHDTGNGAKNRLSRGVSWRKT